MAVNPNVVYDGEVALAVGDPSVHGTKSTSFHGSVMTFHNISYTVRVREVCCGPCRKVKKKKILDDVSGILKPGLNAIMGPTGSGKSSLLDVLARRKDPKLLTGTVLLDGKTLPKNFQYISGYVVQDDLLLGTISVRESLWFCANLRLSSKMSKTEKKERIDGILKELGLELCADTKIGNQIIRGISGGERKRTAIALELILEPQILFLDEPTTGLDAATASSVMELLKNLGRKGNTIVCSIHQPRYSIFKLFDSLTLLAGGSQVYHGDSAKALDHFQTLGYVCEPHDNPADFFLDVLNGTHDSKISANDGDVISVSSSDVISTISTNVTEKLASAYKKGNEFSSLSKDLEKISTSATKSQVVSSKMYATGFPHQLGVLLMRAAKNAIRDPQGLIGNVALNIILGVVFGLIYYQLDHSPDAGIQNRLGILFFICTNLLFGSVSSIDAFKVERQIFIHEHVSGYYRVISYYLSKVLADLIPLRTIAPLIFCSITYWMVGLNHSAAAFFTFVLCATLVGYASIGIGLFYSATMSKTVAELVLILTFVFTIIFSGLLVNVDTILPWLAWLKYLSIARYGLVGLAVNELRGQNFTSCGGNLTTESSLFGATSGAQVTRPDNATVCISIQGEEYLHSSLSVGSSATEINDWDLWQNVVALGCIIIGLYTLTYIQLMRVKTYS